jgi:hypothetical protein
MKKRITPMNCPQSEYLKFLVDTGQYTQEQMDHTILSSTAEQDIINLEKKNLILTSLYNCFSRRGKFTHDKILSMLSISELDLENRDSWLQIKQGNELFFLPLVRGWTAMDDYRMVEEFYFNRNYITVAGVIGKSAHATKKRLKEVLGNSDFTNVIGMKDTIKQFHLYKLKQRVEQFEYADLVHFLNEAGFNG